ncbi:hypothetical protein ABTZ58_18815 [Streptomyces sp. NPDC094143]|uniref:hypothetical protein n=1 Tax=Streptomyces sp. NPDC094143 TaxID=3155310 RepID=UPI00332D563B
MADLMGHRAGRKIKVRAVPSADTRRRQLFGTVPAAEDVLARYTGGPGTAQQR